MKIHLFHYVVSPKLGFTYPPSKFIVVYPFQAKILENFTHTIISDFASNIKYYIFLA